MTRLAQALSIKPGESRMALPVIGIMLFTATGAALGGTGIEALFFARFGVEYLPYMFLGLGVTSMLISFGTTAALGRIPRRLLYVTIPLLLALVLIVARIALFSGAGWLYPALWLGKEILNSLTGIMIWGIAGAVCNTRQAKRLFPLFNASRILGQVVGGFMTGMLVNIIGVENLLLVWAGALLLAFVFSRLALRSQPLSISPQKSKQKQPSLAEEMQRGYRYVRASRLMRWISVAAVLFSLLYFSITLPFSRAITEQYPAEENLAAFLGLFNGLTTGAAFLVSLLLTNRLFARLGIMLCLLIFPLVYLAGFASLVMLPVFVIIVSFRFVQMLWLSGIADPAYQAMFNVVPPERRDQVRTFISGVPEQAGTFIAGAVLIVGEQTLAPQQLYLVGLAAAALCTFAIYRARSGYNEALVDALRAGNPHLFYSEEEPFGGFRQDALAVRAVLHGLSDPDPILRRVSAEILAHLSLPESEDGLLRGLRDTDPFVRSACVRALAHLRATSAQEPIRALLQDPEADVRAEAVSALASLAVPAEQLVPSLYPLLDDPDARVSTRAASLLLRLPSPFGERADDQTVIRRAKSFLRSTAALGELADREQAIIALGEWGDAEAFSFLVNELQDQGLPVAIRRVILTALARTHPHEAMPFLIDSLGHADLSIWQSAAHLLGQLGETALPPLLAALRQPQLEEGALLALGQLSPPPAAPIEQYTHQAVSLALEYDHRERTVRTCDGHEAVSLLAESLQNKSNEYGMRALRAIGLLGDRGAMDLAIDVLRVEKRDQRANVIEAIESLHTRWRRILQPLLRIWEEEQPSTQTVNWQQLVEDDDDWLRDCALFAAHSLGVMTMENIATLSLMERILFFKRVPLFADLTPTEIKQVAAIAQEESFSDGAIIMQEGDLADMMYIIVSGEVRVLSNKGQQQFELARRKAGEIVGEMAIISREPRSATLTAIGNVRTLSIDQKSFESLLRDRPDVSLAVIRVLTERLKELSNKLHVREQG